MRRKNIVYLFTFLLTITSSVFAAEPIDAILDKAMRAAEKHSQTVEEYEADIYMRTYVHTLKKNYLYRFTHLIPNFVLHDRNSDEGLIEVLSELKFNYPNHYMADIKHIHGTFSQKKVIDMLPSNLLHLNVYHATSSNERFFMPLRKASKKYYNYTLESTFTRDNTTFYTISFTPVYEAPKLLKGNLILEKDTWRVVQFFCEGVDFASDFSVELTMGNKKETRLLPISGIIHQKTSYLGNVVTNRNLVTINYSSITLTEKPQQFDGLNVSNFYQVRLDSVPAVDDSLFWEEKRDIPLQTREKEILNQFYSEERKRKREESENDSLSSQKNNSASWAKTMVMNSSYKYRSTNIDYSGVFNPTLFGYSSLDGLTYGQKLNINYELKRQSSLDMKAFVGYMFKRKEIFTDISGSWNYNPAHMGKLSLSVGNGNRTYSSIFLEEIQDSLINQGLNLKDLSLDYYKDYYIRLYNTVEIRNGFSIGTGLDYHIRDAADSKVDASPETFLALETPPNTDGISKMLKRRNTFAPVITLIWTPEQYYRFERRQKIYVRSPYPTFKLEFSKGLKGVLGGDSEYNRFEIDISQNIQLALMQSFQYHIGMGFFSNQKSEYFTDFAFFAKRNFPETWDDGIGGVFNLLDRQLYNASDTYIQNHFMYESPFLILNLIPILSKGVVTERLYLSHLYNPYIRSYAEFGYGIGNNFFNAAAFGSFHKLKLHEVGFKISLNIFKK